LTLRESIIVEKKGIKMQVWQCRKCGTKVRSNGMPNTWGCPKGGTHQWVRLV